jgi:Tol biopolymer transport system component
VFDLDLDATGGQGATDYFESFESGGLGSFAVQNLDAGRHDLEASDGFRCQYNDPDWTASNSYGRVDCFLGASAGQADAIHWQLDGPDAFPGLEGRGFSGTHSLYYGIPLGPDLGYTTPLRTLEAAGTAQPIHLDWGRVCEQQPGTRCVENVDCPVGDRCVAVEPVLAFKHQVDLAGYQILSGPGPGETVDRGVVQAQLADAAGLPVGDWINLEPFENVYDTTPYWGYSACSFDPVDDGNTEDDFFDPTDPSRRLGPSSTCYPAEVFSWLGETFNPYSGYVGNADGPGLEGQTGLGTWVESRFGLGRFKGRSIRLRFVATALEAGSGESWEQVTTINPSPGDDGWWIDDVEVSHALTAPATVTADEAPNSFLPGHGDDDGDGTIDACDTCPSDADPSQADQDGDGIGDSCDNCLGVPNPDQADTDGDGLGDRCEACPAGDGDDTDGDGLPCSIDNCATVANVDQSDSDGDGVGDACDPCPTESDNENVDDDGDGAICGFDSCPTRYNPGGSSNLRLSGVLSDLGSGVVWSALGPDDRTAIYIVGSELTAENNRLLAVVPGRTRPVTLHGRETPASWISTSPPPRFSPDASHVVYRLAEDYWHPALFSVPSHGGTPLQLSAPMAPGGSVRDFALTGDGSHVVYTADQDTAGQIELYSVPIEGGPAVKLNGPLVAGADVVDFALAPDDPSRVFYLADQDMLDSEELYVVPLQGGASRRLNPSPIQSVESFQVTRDGSRAVLLVRLLPSGEQLYGVEVDSASAVPLGEPQTSYYQFQPFELTPDEMRVVALNQSGSLFSVPIGGGPAVDLGDATEFGISHDSSRVILRSDRDTPGVWELYSVPISGGSITKISGPLTAGGNVMGLSVDPAAPYVVYRADQEIDELPELFSVPIDGGEAIKLNAPLPVGGGVQGDRPVFSPDGRTLLYLAGENLWFHGGSDVYVVPVDGGGARKVNAGWVGSTVDAIGQFSSDGRMATYHAFDARYRMQLVATDVSLDDDPDGDGILHFCDSCPGVPNPDQATGPDFDMDGFTCIDDTCPWLATMDQTDSDADGAGDSCDCAPGDATARPPDEVAGVRAERLQDETLRLSWASAAGADLYAVSRSTLSLLSATQLGECVDAAISTTWFEDSQAPPMGDGYAYLVQGVDTVCGGGTLGPGSDWTERDNLDPLACP